MIGNLSVRKRPPRHRPGDPFIKGPIPFTWIASACRLPGSGLHVAMACRFLCCRFRPPNRWAWTPPPEVCGSPSDRLDADSMRPSWRGCWPWSGSRVASWPFPSWISRSRTPGQTAGRCMGRSLGVGGSPLLGSPGSLSTLEPSVGCLPVGRDRPISSWRWAVGRISASRVLQSPGALMNWSGPGWSLSAGRQAGLRS
jgi:hypothetical protein